MTYEKRMAVLAETAKEDGIESEEGRRVFAYLCSAAMDYHDAANVTPSRILVQALGYTKYRVSKELAILKKLGLVERTTCGFPAYETYTENGLVDWDEAHPPLNGFGLTQAGYKSKTYEKADKMQYDEYKHMCDSRSYEFSFLDENGRKQSEEEFCTKEEAEEHIKELEAKGCTDIKYKEVIMF